MYLTTCAHTQSLWAACACHPNHFKIDTIFSLTSQSRPRSYCIECGLFWMQTQRQEKTKSKFCCSGCFVVYKWFDFSRDLHILCKRTCNACLLNDVSNYRNWFISTVKFNIPAEVDRDRLSWYNSIWQSKIFVSFSAYSLVILSLLFDL